jgi:hypothetical protein
MTRTTATFSGFAALALAAGVAQASPLVTCGGVSFEGRTELKALESSSNVRLEFATAGRGAYVADVALAVADARGRPVLNTVSEGPVCLLALPAGRYRVNASYAGTTRTATVDAPASLGKPRRIVIAYPGEKWDGIKASEEEKAPVRNR